MKYLLILFSLQLAQGGTIKDPKFSIFNVVTFENEPCTAQSDNTIKGNCHTADECNSMGGQNDGNCASGFGICCVVIANECGTVNIVRNNTHLANANFPGVNTETAQTCVYNIQTNNFEDTICQIRLDFDIVQTVAPSNGGLAADNGVCSDTIAVESVSGKNPPTLCGDISGTHMYVETAMMNPGATVTITTGADAFSRRWRIRTSYFDCYNIKRAPTDCLQYFTGLSGNVMSYGWTAQQVLIRNQAYTNCFRQEVGFCSIEFSVTNSGESPDFFDLTMIDVGARRNPTSCNGGANVMTVVTANDQQAGAGKDGTNYFCGGQFALDGAATSSASVKSDALPFELRFISPNTGNRGINDNNVGFNIMWRQLAC